MSQYVPVAERCRYCEKCDRCLVCEPDIDPFLGHMNTCGIPCACVCDEGCQSQWECIRTCVEGVIE